MIDGVGVADDGTPVVVAVRDRLGLAGLGDILDGLARVRPGLALLPSQEGASPGAAPRLLIVAKEFDVQVRPADFVIENFQTVAIIARFVQRAAAR